MAEMAIKGKDLILGGRQRKMAVLPFLRRGRDAEYDWVAASSLVRGCC